MAELVERGYEKTTTEAIAKRAGASKQTLYRWFGDKQGIFRALVERNAAQVMDALGDQPLDATLRVRETLIRLGELLLDLLLSPESVALNRAAMSSLALATTLRESGRERVGARIESWFAALHDAGEIDAPDPAAAFRTFFGLVVADHQIGALLGHPVLAHAARAATVRRGVEQFLKLHSGR